MVILEHAYALAEQNLIHILYCIKINICISSIVDVIVDLFIQWYKLKEYDSIFFVP